MAEVAFLGLGKMGSGMAARLLHAGHRVRVHNRTLAKARALQLLGAKACGSAREACAGADAVFSMVSDDAASRAIWFGAEGALAAELAAGAFAIECSTLSHAWVMTLAGAATARGLRYLDAPVTGLPDAARAGELTLLVGAERADLDAARALLSAVARVVLHFGAIGAGTAYKLVINMIGAVQIASLAEGLALAERAGLDLAVVVEALATSQAASPQVVRNARRMLAGDHAREVVFTPQLRRKDVDYALELAAARGLGTPFAACAALAFRDLCEAQPSEVNESQVIEIARARRSGAG